MKEDEDASMYVCKAGHMAIRKARTGKKNQGENQKHTYDFDIEKCKVALSVMAVIKRGQKVKHILFQ